jgi:type VI secretion system protein ImpK
MTSSAPTLIGAATAPPAHSLLDLMYDGFYALFMLRHGSGPEDQADLAHNMAQFLDEFGRAAAKHGAEADAIGAAKYAFCAAVDEIILRSSFAIRDAWSRRPLQLILFGDQLAGENFFDRLEALRTRGSAHLQALEVFHMCLLMGFQGKYLIEGPEKLRYLTARLGDEIANMKGKRGGFAPHADRPDTIVHKLGNEVPLWVLCSVFALIAMIGYVGLRASLASTAAQALDGYQQVVKLAPPAANLTITLP